MTSSVKRIFSELKFINLERTYGVFFDFQAITLGIPNPTAKMIFFILFLGLSEAKVELECGEDIINLISNHFLTIRHNEDLFAEPIWPTILPHIGICMVIYGA